jgi:hypothetical protein
MDVIVMTSVAIGQADIVIDYPNDRFFGSIEFGWSKHSIEVGADIAFEINGDDFWFVGGGANIDILDFAEVNSRVYIARNYNGWMHTFPVSLHPDNSSINGFHLDVNYEMEADIGIAGFDLGAWAYFHVDWDGDLGGGMKLDGTGYFDIWIVGGSAGVELELALAYARNCLSFHGDVGVHLKLWVGCCNRRDSCWRTCWKWGIPCGVTACFNLTVSADYSCRSGWDFGVDW